MLKCQKLIGLRKAQEDLEFAEKNLRLLKTGKFDDIDFNVCDDVQECGLCVAVKEFAVETCAKQKHMTCEDCQK